MHRIAIDPAQGIFEYVFEPDGNLATEFVAMEEVLASCTITTRHLRSTLAACRRLLQCSSSTLPSPSPSTQVYQAEMTRKSNDPFWCLLPVDPPFASRRATYGDEVLAGFPSSRQWECLDIAAPSTLGGLNRSALNFHCPNSDDW